MILLLPLLVVSISADLVQQAMENVTHEILNQWVSDSFEPFTLARRIAAFSPKNKDIIVA